MSRSTANSVTARRSASTCRLRDETALGGEAAGQRACRRCAARAILVVEDDQRVRRVSVRRLKELGYATVEADSGPAALQLLDRAIPSISLFTDVVMPGGMTGLDLAREVRRRRPELKVLFTSGYAEPAMIEGGTSDCGAPRGSASPIARADLASKLSELLDHR